LGLFPRETEKSVPALLDRLQDDSAEVRVTALLSLGKLGKNKSGVEEALRKFSNDPDPLTQLNSLVALAMLGKVDDSQLPELAKALANKEEATAKAAVRVLSDIGLKEPGKVLTAVGEVLAANDSSGAGNALRVLRNMKGAAAPALPQIVEFYDRAGDQTRREIVDAVLRIDQRGDHALVVLAKAVKAAPDASDRREALEGLLRFRSTADRLLDPAMGAFKDEDPVNRFLAVRIVRGLGQDGVRALPDLIALTKDPDVRVRTPAITAIAAFRPSPPEVFDALERSLKDKDFRVRLATATALKQLEKDHPEKVANLLKQAVDVETHDPTRRAMASMLKGMAGAGEGKSEGPEGQSARGTTKP